jgi:dihydrofolate reductase
MRRIVVHEFMTLDGVMQAPGGADEDSDGGFAHGGWTIPYWHDDIGARFFATMQRADAMLLGRKTWQIHSVFEKMDDPFAQALNAVSKYVVSTTLGDDDMKRWRNSTLIRGDVAEEVRKLKEQPGKDILSDGSSVLIQTLIAAGLVDELQLHVYPVSLGGGKTIFPEGKRADFELVEAKPLPTGVTFMQYRRGAS